MGRVIDAETKIVETYAAKVQAIKKEAKNIYKYYKHTWPRLLLSSK